MKNWIWSSFPLPRIDVLTDKKTEYNFTRNSFYGTLGEGLVKDIYLSSALVQNYQLFREHFVNHFGELVSTPEFVQVLSLFRETTSVRTLYDDLTKTRRSKEDELLHPLLHGDEMRIEEAFLEQLLKWLISQNVVEQQHTVRNVQSQKTCLKVYLKFVYFICPPVSNPRGMDAFPGYDSVSSSLEKSCESETAEVLPQEIKEQMVDLPSFITADQRVYIGKELYRLCDELERNEREKWRELQFESAIEVQKLFVKLVKNYFDGQTPLKAVEYYENLTRDHLDYLCDSFSEFLIVTEATDPVTSKMATLYNP